MPQVTAKSLLKRERNDSTEPCTSSATSSRPAKRFYKASEVCSMILQSTTDSDDDDVLCMDDEYIEDRETESDSENETDVDSTEPSQPRAPVPTTSHPSDVTWDKNVTVSNKQFCPSGNVGFCNADAINDESTSLDIFSLFIDDDLLQMLVDMTNLRAASVKVAKPNDY